MKNKIYASLPEYVDYLQMRGNYVLLRKAAIDSLGISSTVFNTAVHRLIKKGRVVNARHGFYIIVPLEYKMIGSTPPSWFIDELMQFHKLPYYVGLLSAAALHGAAHQQPQEFQVVTNKVLRPIIMGRVRIQFYFKKEFDNYFVTNKVKTPTGYMCVSSPEVTAFDLLKYVDAVGQINNAATVLIELAEKISAKKLPAVASKFPLAVVQRLGFLLDKFVSITFTKYLHEWFIKQNAMFIPLVPSEEHCAKQKNLKWKLWVNEKIEVDEL